MGLNFFVIILSFLFAFLVIWGYFGVYFGAFGYLFSHDGCDGRDGHDGHDMMVMVVMMAMMVIRVWVSYIYDVLVFV